MGVVGVALMSHDTPGTSTDRSRIAPRKLPAGSRRRKRRRWYVRKSLLSCRATREGDPLSDSPQPLLRRSDAPRDGIEYERRYVGMLYEQLDARRADTARRLTTCCTTRPWGRRRR